MLLIEGPDRCGKSTVASHLRTLLPGWSYRHHTKPPVTPYTYFTYFLADTHPRVIVDRNHWSGYAYGKAYFRTREVTDHQWRCMELAHLCRGTEVILMTDDAANIRSRWSKDEMYSDEKLEDLVGFYDDLLKGKSEPKSYLPSRSYDLTDLVRNDRPTDMLLAIAARARDIAHRCSQLLPASVGFGSYQPEFLVVGEAPGPRLILPGDNTPSMPFDRGPGSEWLWKAFDEIGLIWWEGYYTNASAFTGPDDFAQYVNGPLGRPSTILCLGNQSQGLVHNAWRRELLAEETRIEHVDHPNYVRRFRHAQFDVWSGQISSAMEGHLCSTH